MFRIRLSKVLPATALGLFAAVSAMASSHSDAPLIKQDPQANLTDVYAFVGNNSSGTKVLNVVVNVHPFCGPGDGVTYDKFADDVLYSIHLSKQAKVNGAYQWTGSTDIRYNFRFSATNSGFKNPNTIISYGLGTAVGAIQTVGDAHQNYTQTYSIERVAGSSDFIISGGKTLMVPPPNVGNNVTPLYNDSNAKAVSGATSNATLDPYTKQTVYTLSSGETVFAGLREDSFYADAPGIFDLLNSRIVLPSPSGTFGQNGGGVDGFKGYNVLTYAIQIPISSLNLPADNSSIGVFATTSRQRVTLRTDGNGQAPTNSGGWVQVGREANPLFNEVLVALKDKDKYNQTLPTDDAVTFKTYAENPEIAALINAVYHLGLAEHGRTDLVGIYIPDLIKVDTSTDPVVLYGQPGYSRLSFIGGDFAKKGGVATTTPAGWPNGRRLGDDVVDIALTAVANGPAYKAPLTLVGDNVPSNDAIYNFVFPYAATPNSGTNNSKDH